MLNYAVHAKADSLYNTPPVFAVYMACLVTRWLKKKAALPKWTAAPKSAQASFMT